MPQAHGVEDLNGPEQWFRSLPIITRNWFAFAILCTCSGNFGVVNIMSLIFHWESLTTKFEIWRLLTCFGYIGKFDFSTAIGLYMIVQFSKQYELSGVYNTGGGGGTADYVYALMIGA